MNLSKLTNIQGFSSIQPNKVLIMATKNMSKNQRSREFKKRKMMNAPPL